MFLYDLYKSCILLFDLTVFYVNRLFTDDSLFTEYYVIHHARDHLVLCI